MHSRQRETTHEICCSAAEYNIPHYQACSLQCFTVYNLCIWFGWSGRKAAKDEPLGSFYNTTLPSLFFKYATSDLAKSYATLAHFRWFMLTYGAIHKRRRNILGRRGVPKMAKKIPTSFMDCPYYNNPVLIGFHKTWNVEALIANRILLTILNRNQLMSAVEFFLSWDPKLKISFLNLREVSILYIQNGLGKPNLSKIFPPLLSIVVIYQAWFERCQSEESGRKGLTRISTRKVGGICCT